MTSFLLFAVLLGSEPAWPKRPAFAASMKLIKDGDSPARVRNLLGEPDEVLASSSGNGKVKTSWRYGTSGKGSIATLATIIFDGKKVLIKHGTDGKAAKQFDEVSLRTALARLWEIEQTPMGVLDFTGKNACESEDPLRYIRAACFLSPLGAERAMALLHEFSLTRDQYNDNWLHFLLRILFDVPKSGWMQFPAIAVKFDKAMLNRNPRWPIVLVGGIPFCNAVGCALLGKADSYEDSELWMLKHSRFRPVKMNPPDDPFAVAKLINEQNRWLDADSTRELLYQILRLVRTAYVPERIFEKLTWSDFESIHQEFLKVGARWDKARQCYVRADSCAIQ